MAYVAPTAADLKARFAEFFDVPDATVLAVIEDAQRSVSTSWLERDYAPAIMLLAAHLMISEGAVERADPNGDGTSSMTSTGAVKSYRVGEVQISYAGAGEGPGGQSMSADALATTYYGSRFMALRRANFAGPLVA
ncbi:MULTISPECIES: DUF4054 domain-containing protein [unclassified Aurantimonas]|uniref:DUF4054 domain-containing protein n=1 Tax=unclassified Aurantimonas TaxID=2638230 RepID=UPI002E19303F|nr:MULTISPECIES: DUF4054 domain-containing protein [unclassified Aurantimonas]MEC5289389.1 DUF4054 domain-containing protein [Aurantimonas sp. C2-3-R2]MEC5410469.1 DUF4054 domain-containing protein [Aurantimonas sp. C2-4-R8]